MDVNIFFVQPWSLQISLIHVLSPTNVAHRDLIFLYLGDILTQRVALDYELMSVSDIRVLLQDISDCVPAFVRFLMGPGAGGGSLDQNLKDL